MKPTNNQLLIEMLPVFNTAFQQIRVNKDVKQDSYLAFLERPNEVLLKLKELDQLTPYIYGIIKNRKYADFHKESKYTILGDDIKDESEETTPLKECYSYKDYDYAIKNLDPNTKLYKLKWNKLSESEKTLLYDYANYESFRDLAEEYDLTAMGLCKRFKKIKFKLCN